MPEDALSGLKRWADGERSPSISDDVHADSSKFGTVQDAADMHRMGKFQTLHVCITAVHTESSASHKLNQCQRNFHSVSILGLTSIIMGTWLSILANASFCLINGGRAGSVWTYLATWVCTLTVIASMAEMASMAPTSGGQYHWVSEFAPPSVQRLLSYISGWLSALGWQTIVAGSAYLGGSMMLTLSSLDNQGYLPTAWQQTLLMLAISLFSLIFNVWGARLLPWFEGVALVFNIVGFFAVMVPLWALAPKVAASTVFFEFSNFGGWSSLGSAVVIGQIAASGAMVGADSAAHMSEEVENASRTVPRMMMATIILNGAMGFASILTYCFVIQDLESQIVNSAAAFPYIVVFTETGSKIGAIGMTVPLIVLCFAANINAVAAGSRQAWSFARDDGLPFPRWLTKTARPTSTPVPLNAMLACLTVVVIIALLNLGGSEVFDSIIGLQNGAIGGTYAVSIGCVFWRRLFGAPLPRARWSLGRMGVFINGFAFFYQVSAVVISFFPLFAQVTAQTMNWSIALFGGIAALCVINYIFNGRRKYRGPVVDVING